MFLYTRTSVIEWVLYTGAIVAGGYNKLQLDKLYREIENENKHLKKIAEEQSKAFPLNYNER